MQSSFNEATESAFKGDFWLELIQQALQTVWTHYIPLDVYERCVGKVVRVRWTDPDLSFYVLFEPDGLVLKKNYAGVVDARVRMRVSDLVGLFQGNDNVGVNVVGDVALVRDVLAMVRTFNIWSLLRWLITSIVHDASRLNPLIRWLERFDPAWIDHLEPVPETLDRIYTQLRLNQHYTQTQNQELRRINRKFKWVFRLQLLLILLVSVFGIISVFK